jgi:4-hydroxybenzoate polyprenyltransferase
VLYQQHLMRDRTRDGCFRAFLNNNWFGAAVFAGLLLNYF